MAYTSFSLFRVNTIALTSNLYLRFNLCIHSQAQFNILVRQPVATRWACLVNLFRCVLSTSCLKSLCWLVSCIFSRSAFSVFRMARMADFRVQHTFEVVYRIHKLSRKFCVSVLNTTRTVQSRVRLLRHSSSVLGYCIVQLCSATIYLEGLTYRQSAHL